MQNPQYTNLNYSPANMGHKECPLLTMKIMDHGEPLRGDIDSMDWHPDLRPGCTRLEGAICYMLGAQNGHPRIENQAECPILQKAKDILE